MCEIFTRFKLASAYNILSVKSVTCKIFNELLKLQKSISGIYVIYFIDLEKIHWSYKIRFGL